MRLMEMQEHMTMVSHRPKRRMAILIWRGCWCRVRGRSRLRVREGVCGEGVRLEALLDRGRRADRSRDKGMGHIIMALETEIGLIHGSRQHQRRPSRCR